jgi:NTP pyrophosphatase (non-canonical NTP hydrolase)
MLTRDQNDVDESHGATLNIRDAQKRAWENKLTKGFNTTDVALEFGLLVAEVGEAFTAWRKHLPDFGEELADVAIYLMAIAEMNGIDLESEIDRKIEKNAGRTYERDEHGVAHRVQEG